MRVDTYTIPLVEIGKQWNQKIRLCYVGESPKPKLIVKSESQKPGDISPMEPDSKISLSKYLEFTLGRVPGR